MNTLVSTIWQGFIRQFARSVVICCLWLLPALVLQAGIKTCKLADGSVVFQDTACAAIVTIEKKSAAAAKRIPFGIDKTWFESPPVVPDQAYCTKAGCDCGKGRRKFENGLPLAIADALYLDGSWHRLEATLSKMALASTSGAEYEDLRLASNEAACNILMSQKILRKFGQAALAELRDKKRYAEDMGMDNPDDCDAGDTLVCEHTDNIALYNRIVSDIKALGNSARTNDDSLEPSELVKIDRLKAENDAQAQAELKTARQAGLKVEPDTQNQPELKAAQRAQAELMFGLEKTFPKTSATLGLSHIPHFADLPFDF